MQVKTLMNAHNYAKLSPTALLHNDNITSDDVTDTVGEVPIGDKKSDTTHDDVMLNSKGKPL